MTFIDSNGNTVYEYEKYKNVDTFLPSTTPTCLASANGTLEMESRDDETHYATVIEEFTVQLQKYEHYLGITGSVIAAVALVVLSLAKIKKVADGRVAYAELDQYIGSIIEHSSMDSYSHDQSVLELPFDNTAGDDNSLCDDNSMSTISLSSSISDHPMRL